MKMRGIPKKIHYCWFGGGQLPDEAMKCINSWKRFMPDYEIIEWNESNFDVAANRYAREAYGEQKYAFVSDYARLKVLYEEGGVYFDVDVELIKPITDETIGDGFLAMEDSTFMATGLGFACRPKDDVIAKMLEDYKDIGFIDNDGNADLTPCPIRNTNSIRQLIEKKDGKMFVHRLRIFESDFFNPLDYKTGILKKTENTLAIHHGVGSWLDDVDKGLLKYRHKMIKKYGNRIGCLLYFGKKMVVYGLKKPQELRKILLRHGK